MNCQSFQTRMQTRLDERLSLDGDRELNHHAQGCPSCSSDLQAWRSIESVIESTTDRQPSRSYLAKQLDRHTAALYPVALLAASALLAFTLVSRDQPEADLSVASSSMPNSAVPAPTSPAPTSQASTGPASTNPASNGAVPTDAVANRTIPTGGDRSDLVQSDTERSHPGMIGMHTTAESEEWWRSVGQGEWLAQSMPTVRSVREGVAPLRRSLVQLVSILTFGRPNSIIPLESVGEPESAADSGQTS